MRTLLVCILVAMVGCTPSGMNPTNPDDPATASRSESKAGESFKLAPGQERGLPAIGLVVRFADVIADHRCPLDVTCVWEGDAEVAVTVVQDGEERRLRLHTPRDLIGPTAADLRSGHRLELLELEPEPVSARGTPRDEYRATFRVAAPRE